MRLMSSPSKPTARRGSAAVEFAVIAPILATLMLGMVEVTRAIQVKEFLSDTARSGARLGAQPGVSTDNIKDNINSILSNNGINTADATITVKVNDASAEAATAERGDKITVQVGVPISKITWVTPLFFTSASVTSESLSMVRH